MSEVTRIESRELAPGRTTLLVGAIVFVGIPLAIHAIYAIGCSAHPGSCS